MEARTQVPTLQEFTIVERIARIVSRVRGTRPDYAQLAAELEPAIPFDVFGIVLLRHDRQAVRVTVCIRTPDGWSTQYRQHPFEESKLEQVMAAPVLSVQAYPEGIDGPPAETGDALSGFPHLHHTLIAPLMVDEHVLGTLELGSALPHAYADETLQRLIRAVVDVLATAIESAQIGGSVEIQDRHRQALKHVSSALTSEMDLPMIFNSIVVGIAEALHIASAIVTLDKSPFVGAEVSAFEIASAEAVSQTSYHTPSIDRPSGDQFTISDPLASSAVLTPHLQAQSGLDGALLSKIVSQPVTFTDQSIIGYSLCRRQPIVSHDIAIDERFPASHIFASELAVHSIYSYPLVIGEKVYGTLLLCSPDPGGFTPLKADILSLFASQATIAIYQGLLHESAQQHQRVQATLEQLVSRSAVGTEAASTEVLQTPHHTSSVDRLSVGTPLMTSGGTYSLFSSLSSDPIYGVQFSTVIDSAGHTLLDTLTQQLTDAWFIVNSEGYCVYLNPAAELVCGVRLAFAAARPLNDIFTALLLRARNAEDLSSYLHDFATASEMTIPRLRCTFAAEPRTEHSPEGYPLLLLESSPSDQHYQLTRIPFYNPQGALTFNVLRMHDITTQVRDEKNKSVLLSSISHDLRTPLTAIKAAVTGLLQPGIVWDEDMRREILADIDAETDHLGALVNSLVEMSRIEMGALVLEKEWCDIVEIVHAIISRLERTLEGRRVCTRFGRSASPHLPLIFADYVQLGRVFHNLLENAIRYSPDGTDIFVSVDVVEAPSIPGDVFRAREYGGRSGGPDRGRQVYPPNSIPSSKANASYLRTCVIDYGPGITQSERERIFNTFYSLDARGSGLGLAICRGIIEAHSGHIWVESPPDSVHGSCFVFVLPLSSPTALQETTGR